MDLSPYHYGKTYAVSLRVFCRRVERGGRLIETAILKPEGKELPASLFGTSFFWYLYKRDACLPARKGEGPVEGKAAPFSEDKRVAHVGKQLSTKEQALHAPPWGG